MALETATYISGLEPSNPAATDQLRQADDHLRLIKTVLKNTFPNITGPVTLTQDELNDPSVFAVGMITMWYGSAASVPSGWAICNGSTVPLSDGSGNIATPDLRGRVPMGANASYAYGATLGAETATANTSASGSHTHTVDGGSHTHSAAATSSFTGITADTDAIGDPDGPTVVGEYVSNVTINDPGHSHTVTVGSSTHSHAVSEAAAHTHSVSVSPYQPTMALHFIMKV